MIYRVATYDWFCPDCGQEDGGFVAESSAQKAFDIHRREECPDAVD